MLPIVEVSSTYIIVILLYFIDTGTMTGDLFSKSIPVRSIEEIKLPLALRYEKSPKLYV